MERVRTNADDVPEQHALVANGGPGDLSLPQVQKKQTHEPLHNVLAMTKGEGENSYSNNSQFQAIMNKEQQSALIEGLELVSPPEQGAPVVVADLGSSSSANSISNVALIVEKLRIRSPPDAEFLVYFNDLPSNDFNELFRLLSLQDEAKNFFGAGVPGSFYGRLFPRSHVHVFHSSICLHWLSKVPDVVLDKNSPAYNGGNIWYMHSRTAVAAAYKEQASMDLRNFLRAREVELHPGGLLYFTYLGRDSSDPLDWSGGSALFKILLDMNDILTDLVSEGLLDKELRDSFNFPLYSRSVEEITEAVESGGAFRVLTAKNDHLQKNANDLLNSDLSGKELAVKLVQFYKAFSESIMEAVLPKSAMDVLWQRMEELELSRISGHDLPLRDLYMTKVCLIKM